MGAESSSYHDRSKELLKHPRIAWWLTWPVIIIVTIIFWPIGVLLILKRISKDKKAAIVSGRLISIIGWVSLVIAVFGSVVSLSEGIGSDDVYAILFFIIAGVVLITIGQGTKRSAEKIKKYISIIINHGERSLTNIAAAIPTSYEACSKDLQQMIKKGYFNGAYINELSNQIIFPIENVLHEKIDTGLNNNKNANLEMVVVSCTSCGANNKLAKGSVEECQYCGSFISG